jgi:uncharacterized protein (TIGR03083 family)
MTTPDDVHDARDPELPGRLLTIERDALIPLLRGKTDQDFALPVVACPGWTVRDVLAHCAGALTRVTEGRLDSDVFTPESNDRDIAERGDYTNAQVVDELERGMSEAGPVLAGSDGTWDGVVFGEWVHAGDIREALGEPEAYGGPGLPDALALLARATREWGDYVPLEADLDDLDEPLQLGKTGGERRRARFSGDGPTLVRLYTGRSVEGSVYELTGVEAKELNIFA